MTKRLEILSPEELKAMTRKELETRLEELYSEMEHVKKYLEDKEGTKLTDYEVTFKVKGTGRMVVRDTSVENAKRTFHPSPEDIGMWVDFRGGGVKITKVKKMKWDGDEYDK